jgi:hypothetical protein
MYKRITFIAAFFFTIAVQAQHITKADLKYLAKGEDTLSTLADQVQDEITVGDRIRSDSMFTRVFVRALKTPHSFYYAFDSLPTITIVTPPDSTFRIFTWQYAVDEQVTRQRGVIQMNTTDGHLQLYPLYDQSEFTDAPNDSIRGPKNWIGAIYYKIIQKESGGKKYYTLLGFDENGFRSTKKWIDVLTFNESQQPVFGGDYFSFEKTDSNFVQGQKRFDLEFKKEGRARLNYDADMDMIIYDHLISENNEPEKKYTLIPDGDSEGLKWENGTWKHVSKVFNYVTKEDQEPHPDLLMDDNGTINEAKLAEQSKKNEAKKVDAPNYKKKPKVKLPDPPKDGL